MSVGFVVMPSRIPVLATSRISSMFAVSRKNFMLVSLYKRHCINLLRTTESRAPRTFILELIERGHGIVHAGFVIRIDEVAVCNNPVGNQRKRPLRTGTSEDMV